MLIPETIKSIKCKNKVKVNQSMEVACYEIDCENGTKRNIFVNIPKYHKPYKTDRIVDSNNEFVNGFKVVKLANDCYSYVREEDNMLMPCFYDIAFDFNHYGLAIVGKAGSVSWINKDFDYLDSKGNTVSEKEDSWKDFNGWDALFNYSEGDIPLSRLFCGKEDYGRVVYVDKDINVKRFYQYDGEINKNVFRSEFFKGTDFNNNGYAIADNYILYKNGFCIAKEDIIKLCLEEGFIDLLFDDAIEKFENDKKLIKKL